jgi:hypothetical protein
MAFSVAFMDDQYELVNDKHQKGLGDIFNPLMDKDGITSEHFKQIGQIFEFSAMGKTAQGQFCICLAVLMTNLTTNNFFGADSKSPIVLRDYAVALLNTANKLDATLFLDMKQTSVLPDWKRKLKSDKCSNLLKNTMTSHIEYKGFTFVLNTMKPPKWKF